MIIAPPPSFSYNRPKQVRDIPLKAASYRGVLVTTKLHLQNKEPPIIIEYESGLERDLYYCLDHDYYCYDFQPQPVEVRWQDNEGNTHVSYPDCWAVFHTGKQILYQVKPITTLQRLIRDEKWNQELEALRKYCKIRMWELQLVSELDIRTPRVQNIAILRGAAQHPPNGALIEETIEYIPSIFQKGIGKTINQLRDLLIKIINVHTQSALHILQYLLYYQVLSFDWSNLLSKSTLLYLNLDGTNFAEPFYKIKPIKQEKMIHQPVSIEIDLQTLSPEQIEETNQRYEAIKELLEKPDRTRRDIERKAKEIGKGTRTLYKWIKAYEENQWRGLLKRIDKRGNRKSRFSPIVEEIIQKAIDYHLKEQSSIKACWAEICEECKKIGIANPPSYFTIRDRIRNLPAKERKGKQGGHIRYEIPQSVMGELPVGDKPLDLIQMDHTILDIVLVDQQFRKPVGRPWLTLAIDTYSRMVYGYFLSFSNPSSLSVTKALMTGFLPKIELLKQFDLTDPYPIQGLPKRLQIDNSREFRSKHLEQFCRMYRIDLEFRPVRRPDKGAYIERLFRTINDVICNERLPGYAPPLAKRPKDYNPDKEVEKGGLTLPEFEKWFLNYIVRTYHVRIHSGLECSPLEQYQSGITGLEGSLGTNPIIPGDLVKLKFDILPVSKEKHSIHAYGIRWEGNNYNAPVLAKIRRKQRRKSPKIHFRYDPSDISQIWIYDTDDSLYYPVPITGGKGARFIKNNPALKLSLSEYRNIKKQLREGNKPVTSRRVEQGLLERRKIVEQAKEKSKRARREQENAKEKAGITVTPKPKKEKEKTPGKKVEIDWDNLVPLPSKPMGRRVEWENPAPLLASKSMETERSKRGTEKQDGNERQR